MVSRKFVKCFKELHFREHFRTAAFEIICENRAFLKKCGLQPQFINRRDSADQVLQKMLQNYLEHLIHLSTAAPLENILEII